VQGTQDTAASTWCSDAALLWERQSDCEFYPTPFIVGQVDDHGVFLKASELWRVIIGIAENWMKERFAYALHNDGLAGRPANIHRVG